MAKFWTSSGGRLLAGLLGGVAKAALPGPVGGIVSKAVEIPQELEVIRQEKAAARRAGLPAPSSIPAALGAITSTLTQSLAQGGVSKGFPPILPLRAAFPRTSPRSSQLIPRAPAAGVGGALGHPMATGIGDWIGERAMNWALKRTAGRGVTPATALQRTSPMHQGNGMALMRRLLRGGVTAMEAQLLGQNWAAPRGYSTLRWGPQGEAFYYKKRRSMNCCNPKALNRAQRRLECFVKMAQKYVTITQPGARVKLKRRRAK